MKKYGLIGRDIRWSGSPELFRAAYGGKWPYDLLEGDEFEPLWKTFLNGYDGVNITTPYKEAAFGQILALAKDGLGTVSGPALRCGAVNIAVKGNDEKIIGENSDFQAVILCIAESVFPGITAEFIETFGPDAVKKVHQFFLAKGKEKLLGTYEAAGDTAKNIKALVIGCGGAGKAAAVAAAELGCTVTLANRTMERAALFALDAPEYRFAVCPTALLGAAVRNSDIIIYAASGPIDEITRLGKEDFIAASGRGPKIILEANYFSPVFSGKLLEEALEAGATYIGGQEWLRAQAVAGYPILTGEKTYLD
ncbi:MAG: hypothetical protein II465_01805 [Bacteroidales bacterium]|nr:hypothetical protein [Bacteroidales bacterium]